MDASGTDDTPTADALTAMSLVAQAHAVRNGDTTAAALLEAHLDRIARLEPELGAFLTVAAADARAWAEAVDVDRDKGRPLGPLAGVPIAVKDQIVTRGVVSTAGSKILDGWVPPYDATAVARLRAAGAVIVGKTNQDELGMGSSTEASAYKVTKNPWDLARVPGGSSGGSAAAVAAHLAAGALGTDTGGSIRQPASFCGLVGVKPTYGRVSRYGAIAYASSLDQIGPLARSVADASLLLKVIAGHDPKDQTSLPVPAPDLLSLVKHVDLGGLRIGMPAEYLGDGVASDVAAGIRGALAKLEAEGAELVPISLPHTRYAVATYYLVATAEASSNLARFDGVRYGPRAARYDDLADMFARSRAAGFGHEVKRRIMLGTFALSSGYYDAYYLQAQKVRALIRRDFDAAFAEVDLIAGPTSPVTAWAFGALSSIDPVAMYLMDVFTIPPSLAGLPAVSLPVAHDRDGLPVGLQLVGPPLSELRLMQVAQGLENLVPPRRCPYGGVA